MYLSKLSILNYKSFLAKENLQFGPGFNILLGANSSGKTTVLEAIEIGLFRSNPHRSIASIAEYGANYGLNSEVSARFELSLSDLKKLIPGQHLKIPLQGPVHGYLGKAEQAHNSLRNNGLSFEIKSEGGVSREYRLFIMEKEGSWRKINRRLEGPWTHFSIANEVIPKDELHNITDDVSDATSLADALNARIYRFSAERVVRASCSFSRQELQPNAQNLAYCINHLQSVEPHIYSELNKFLRRIFPNIKFVAASPENDHFNLKVHTVAPELKRSDLAIPIDQVGTGVANAVAMLYVVLTAQWKKILLLEEPNSYLHPRALRELLSILHEVDGGHQFFITTHSSDVLRTVDASTVTLLEHDGVFTKVMQTAQNDLREFRAGLLDLGIRLSDLHGCDRVLWVEGETEEAIFPLILAKFYPEKAQGIAVLRVHATGDFESRRFSPSKVAAIYKRLSSATFLAPPAIAVTLDSEARQKSEIEQILKEGAGLVHLLPEPMIEDFLLDAEAVAYVLKTEFDVEFDENLVKEAIERSKDKQDNKLVPKRISDQRWHAANVLKDVFGELAGDGGEYNKAKHGPMLTNWLLIEKPEVFSSLRDWFGEMLR